MKRFAALYAAIDATNKTNEKVRAMTDYFRIAPPEDAAWAVHFLIGRRPKRLISSPKLHLWAAEAAGVPQWLFDECYHAVGDLAETIALILPDSARGDADVARRANDARKKDEDVATKEEDKEGQELQDALHIWVRDRLLPISLLPEEDQRQALLGAWQDLDSQGRLVFNKLITGAFRVGVSQDLVVRAIGLASGVPSAVIAHRLMGGWEPTGEFFRSLFAEDTEDTEASRPYPFCLAHPLEGEPPALGPLEEWHAEWKWDGIRAQLIRRQGQSFVWSRGEELVTDRFPEMVEICDALPEGTVVDGEILAWANGQPLRFMELQKRIGRKTLTKKILQEVPVVLVAFDLLELEGKDIRERPFAERRELLERLVDDLNSRPAQQLSLDVPPVVREDTRLAVDSSTEEDERPAPVREGREGQVVPAGSRLLLSAAVEAATWEELAEARSNSRELNVEGIMLKRRDSPYVVGRKKGLWWKWKIEPLSVDAVLVYAQRGSGKRASLYTDYTFALWNDGKLVVFAKAYSGLTDEEIRRVDGFVRRNTIDKFGPVRTVKPELVMELGFEGIQLSSRHKSGLAVRFPRILRWRHDKRPEDADSLESVREMLNAAR